MTTPRNTARDRLQDAGYEHVSGWLPLKSAKRVQRQIAEHEASVDLIREQDRPLGKPPGRKNRRKV